MLIYNYYFLNRMILEIGFYLLRIKTIFFFSFATSCDINDLGDKIICDCIPGYTGEHCEKCGPGYYGRPKVTG